MHLGETVCVCLHDRQADRPVVADEAHALLHHRPAVLVVRGKEEEGDVVEKLDEHHLRERNDPKNRFAIPFFLPDLTNLL